MKGFPYFLALLAHFLRIDESKSSDMKHLIDPAKLNVHEKKERSPLPLVSLKKKFSVAFRFSKINQRKCNQNCNHNISRLKRDKVFKSGPSKICGRQSLKI